MDLGGGATWDARGALVALGYPYDFDELVVVDLPPDDRHPLYQSERFGTNETDRGLVRYEYRSMADLSFAEDDSVDLIYSGQSIEHVTEEDGDVVLKESFRILEARWVSWPSTRPTVWSAGCSRPPSSTPTTRWSTPWRELQGQGHRRRLHGPDRAGPQLGRTGGGPGSSSTRRPWPATAASTTTPTGCYLLALLIQKPA